MRSPFQDLVVSAFREFVFRNPFRILQVYVDGIEVSQAIQYYRADRHLTDAADRGADNSIPLVMYKPAWVRVYVRSLFAPSGTTVRGRLIVERSFRWIPADPATLTLDPVAPGSVAAESDPDYQAERSTIGATLNFLIPADAMAGNLKLTAQIWREEDGDPEQPDHSFETSVSANLQQTLSLRGILISYDGPDEAGTGTLSLPAPTVADLAATAAQSLTIMPVESWPNVSSAGTLAWETPLTGTATSPGGCSTQWYALNTAIAEVKTNDGNRPDVIYYGLLPEDIPVANVSGCASSGVTAGRNGAGRTMAHEIGHFCGLPHAPCGTPGDANYPAYEPYDPANTPSASLGEYALDINDGEIHLPAEKDAMSYCSPRNWFSLYNYQRLVPNSALNPRWTGLRRPRLPELVDVYVWPWEELIPPHPEWEVGFPEYRAQPLISLIAIVSREEAIDVRSVMRVTATAALPDGRPTAYSLQLLDDKGGVIAEGPLMQLPAQGACKCGGCPDDRQGLGGPPYMVQALVPDVAPGSEMRIVRHDAEPKGAPREPATIWSRKAPAGAPRLGEVRVDLDKGGRGSVRWSAERGSEPLRYAIQFSKDRGKSWNGLAAGLTGDRFEFDPAPLPSGELVFRVLAHDGFHTATALSKPVKLSGQPPIPFILHPRPGGLFAAGRALRLWGATVARGPIDRDAQKFRWLIDGKEAGVGPDLWVLAPRAGRHKCELIVEDADGKARTTVEFETFDAARKPA